MIPRLLVPKDARPPAADVASMRRRPSTLDERTLVPAMLPIVPLDGHSKIPSSLPLEAIAARTVVPRDVKPEEFAAEETSHLPLQPTELDARMIAPELPSSDDRNTNSPGLHGRRHSLFIPADAKLGSAIESGGTA